MNRVTCAALSLLLLVAMTAVPVASDGASSFSSPAQITGFVNRSGDGVSPRFSKAELAVLSDPQHYDRLIGFDGHGYSIEDTPLPDLRAGGLTTPASCFITGSVLEDARGPWFIELDDHEAAFLHSADPASAAMFQDRDGNVVLAFRQDVRLLPHFMETPDAHAPVEELLAKPITDYVIRRSDSMDGPFDDLVAELPVHQSTSPVGFNGVTVDRNSVNTDRKLETADMAYHEFFYTAPRYRQSPEKTVRDLSAALWRTANGHEVVLAVGLVVDDSGDGQAENLKRTISNVPDRLNPFALYLLISNPDLYFWVEAAVGGPYQWFNLFPEWKVPLGEPLIEHPTRSEDLTGDYPAGVYMREFENGLVLANLECEGRCRIEVRPGLHLVGATGGWDPALGIYAGTSVPLTDGEITYEAVDALTLGLAEGAILVRDTGPSDSSDAAPDSLFLPLLYMPRE